MTEVVCWLLALSPFLLPFALAPAESEEAARADPTKEPVKRACRDLWMMGLGGVAAFGLKTDNGSGRGKMA